MKKPEKPKKDGRGHEPEGVDKAVRKARQGAVALVLAANILKFRGWKGLTQDQIAIAAKISRNTMRAMEKATRDPKLSHMQAVATALGCQTFQLLRPEE